MRQISFQYFFYLRTVFLAIELKMNWGESGGKGCMYIKGWF